MTQENDRHLLATIHLDRQPNDEILQMIERGLQRNARTWGKLQLSCGEAADGAALGISNSGLASAEEAIPYVTNVLMVRGYQVKEIERSS